MPNYSELVLFLNFVDALSENGKKKDQKENRNKINIVLELTDDEMYYTVAVAPITTGLSRSQT